MNSKEIYLWVFAFIFAIILLNIIFIPLLRLMTGSNTPVVTVMTNSMEHYVDFDEWWIKHKGPYVEKDISKENFSEFPFVKGLYVGDLVIVTKPDEIVEGDIMVFRNRKDELIIHRVIDSWKENKSYGEIKLYQTKGDNHYTSIKQYYLDEHRIAQFNVMGIATYRIPLIGYPKVFLHRLKEIIVEKI